MDKQVQKLKELIFPYIGKTPMQIRSILGWPKDNSSEDIWYYEIKNIGFYKQEIAFCFDNKVVTDITFVKYLLGFKINEKKIYGKEPRIIK